MEVRLGRDNGIGDKICFHVGELRGNQMTTIDSNSLQRVEPSMRYFSLKTFSTYSSSIFESSYLYWNKYVYMIRETK